MAPNTHRGGISIRHFVCNYMHNSKIKGRVRMFYLLNDCSTIEDTFLLVEDICKILSASYGFKHTWQPLSDTTFCAYLHS